MAANGQQLTLNASANASLATTPATTPTTVMATSTPKRLGYASPSTSVICEEVFDDTCQPSAEEISDYALRLGIDPIKESHLLYLAKEGLMAALPAEWKICYSEEKCGHYYYNTKTKQSQWDHPLDAVYRELVEQMRQKYANVASTAATPIIDNSDDVSQLDSGIRSMQGTELELDTTTITTTTATITNEMLTSPVNNSGSGLGGGNNGSHNNLLLKKQLSTLGTFLLSNAASANGTGGVSGGVGVGVGSGVGVTNGSSPNSNTSTSTSGFSGGVSRFLESRSKNFSPVFMPVKNTRFEVAKTNPQISLAMKFPISNASNNAASATTTTTAATAATGGATSKLNNAELTNAFGFGAERKGGFQLSGTGAMFLKSRRQIDAQASVSTAASASALAAALDTSAGVVGVAGTPPPGVKGILRDSSLTDMRRRFERDEFEHEDINKRVRFNLDETKLRGSPEEEPSSSRKLTQSPEISINSDDVDDDDDDDAVNDDDDLWDEDDDVDANNAQHDNDDVDEDDDDDNGCVCVGSISLDSSGTAQRNGMNPFHHSAAQDDKHVRDIRVITVPKAQTIEMLKAQSFSIDLPERDRERDREHAKLHELARSQSADIGSGSGAGVNPSSASYLDKLKENAVVKPLYEDTDSDSKGSSVRSFIINKSEQESLHSSTGPTNPFDLDELGRKHSRDVEQLQRKLNQAAAAAAATATEKTGGLRTLKMATKLVGFLKKDAAAASATAAAAAVVVSDAGAATRCVDDGNALEQLEMPATPLNYEQLKQNLWHEQQLLLKEERERMEEQLQLEIDAIKREHEQKLKSIRHEYDLRVTSHQHQIDEAFELQLEDYRAQLEEELDVKRKLVVGEHKARMSTLQTNHAEILEDLERDLKSEEEILKKEHAAKLMQMRDKLAHELDMEKHRMRELGEDRLYEKVRCEKRLLEDKYRCLKEKYVRLKTDVKLSLERRNRRREAQALHHQSMHTNTNTNTTTGSETERSISNKPSIGNSENRSLSYSTSCQERDAGGAGGGCGGAGGGGSIGTTSTATGKLSGGMKPPVPPKTHLTAVAAAAAAAAAAASASASAVGRGGEQSQHQMQQQQQHRERDRDRSMERSQSVRKSGIASKYIKQLQVNDDTTSLSQSDTTISNNYTKGRYLPAAAAPPPVLASDNGNSDSEALQQCNQENNNNSGVGRGGNGQRKKVFSRTKSASTSRLNSDNYGKLDRPCTPVENLRHQLQKLEDLEDQFPDNTLDTTYHLRYPFTDISNDHATGGGNSSELEFFKHRIHLERDSVRRAKESLRTQRTNFRARQREIKQRHKTTVTRHTLDQLIQEEKELTEMEVNLHRTRALLGEKVIRLRHLEQSLLRIYEKEKPMNMELLSVEQKDDATLSDLSSHSSSGFSSTDFASGTDLQHNMHKRKDYFQQESNECIQNLEILNAEIREILDILGQRRGLEQSTGTATMSMPMISPSELSWSNMLSNNSSSATLAAPTQPTAAMAASGVTLMAQQQQQQHHHLQQQQQHQQTTSASAACAAAAAAAAAHAAQSNAASAVAAAAVLHAPQSIPTLADRLETYRQLAAGRMHTSMGGAILAANTIVSQSPRAVNYTTSLVERTRDLRNWLRQAKTEHELLVGLSMQQHGVALGAGTAIATAGAGVGGATAGGVGVGGGGGGVGASAINLAGGTQTNL